jgi:hypothetical protein
MSKDSVNPSDEAAHALSRRQFCLGAVALAASAGWVGHVATRFVGVRGGGRPATRLAAAHADVMVASATADLRRRLRSDAVLDPLVEAVSFEGAHALSALDLTDEPGGVRITPSATADAPSRQAVEIAIAQPALTLWTMGGGKNDSHYPPAAFAVVPHPVDVDRASSKAVSFGSTTGRSSSSVLPLFLVTDRGATTGYWFAVGWSGSWQVTARSDGDGHHLSFEFPMGGPRGPVGGTIVMGTFAGDGWEAMKDHLSAVSRDVGPPRVVANTWFAHNEDIDEATLLADIPVAASVGVEVYTVDAGWYSKPGLKFGSDGLGTWRVDQTKFPRGLDPVMQAIRAEGMLPGLWFEPERAWKGSTLWKEHPRWLLRDGTTDQALVDFGNPAVQRWAIDLISTAIEQYRLEWIKWDFNMDPAPAWKGDAARELAHVDGVYTVMEQLRSRHPDVVLEMCASGGNRIDSEMIRRADAYWLSDQTTRIDGQRLQSASAAMVLPARYRYTSMAQSSVHGTPGTGSEFPEEAWLTAMSGTFGIMEPFARWPASVRAQAARAVTRFKDVRHLLDGSVRVLRDDADLPNRGWEAWEFSDPATGHAALFAFRQQSPDGHHAFRARHHWVVDLPARGAALPRRRRSSRRSTTV